MDLNRRDFLKLLATLPFGIENFNYDKIQSDSFNKKILVTIQLLGANDALNTIIPYNNPQYYRKRKNIAIRENYFVINSDLALNPNLEHLSNIFKQKRLAIINNVGLTEATLSHYYSLNQWHSTDFSDSTIGWINYLLNDLNKFKHNLVALNLDQSLPGSFLGSQKNIISINQINKINLCSESFEDKLKIIAKLINSDTNIAVYNLSLNGFDTHSSQLKTHSNLLKKLDLAISDFINLTFNNNKEVLLLIHSEMGRSGCENSYYGTNHSHIQSVLMLGNTLKGNIFENQPTIAKFDDISYKSAYDTRSIISNIIENYFNIDNNFLSTKGYKRLDLKYAL